MSINSHRVFYENGTQSKNELGMSSGLFGAMMLVSPQAMMEYPTHDAKQDKYLPFHSNCPTMFDLNVGIASLGDRQPDKKNILPEKQGKPCTCLTTHGICVDSQQLFFY